MPKALYFPHTDIRNEIILKNALLLWDQVETIVPHAHWSPWRSSNKVFNDAVDLIVRPRVPASDEMTQAHRAIVPLVESGVLLTLVEKASRGRAHRIYPIYPEKFLDRTWHMLRHQGFAEWMSNISDYGVPPVVGFLMMSILADACAGTQVQRITDRRDAYSWISRHHAAGLGSSFVTGFDVSQVTPAYDRLATICLGVLDARSLPLKKLVAMRKREERSPKSGLRAMRRVYLTALQTHVEKISKVKTKRDVAELENEFKVQMEQDLADLKTELGLASLKGLFSKEVALSALILGGSLVSPIVGLTTLASTLGGVGVIPLAKAAIDLHGARREILRKHAMSWLFLAGSRRVTLR
jgi:hypothetical protein